METISCFLRVKGVFNDCIGDDIIEMRRRMNDRGEGRIVRQVHGAPLR